MGEEVAEAEKRGEGKEERESAVLPGREREGPEPAPVDGPAAPQVERQAGKGWIRRGVCAR